MRQRKRRKTIRIPITVPISHNYDPYETRSKGNGERPKKQEQEKDVMDVVREAFGLA